jgi:hypothetical protein
MQSTFVGIGTLPSPLSPASVPLPPEPGGGGAHSPAGGGLGKSQFRRLEEKLSTLPTQWVTGLQELQTAKEHCFPVRPNTVDVVTRGDGAPDFDLRQIGNKCAAAIFRRKPVVVGTVSGI